MKDVSAETIDEQLEDREGGEAQEAPAEPSTRPRGAEACTHLGLASDPFVHYDQPSPEHRCYLWMQRDRIDLAHQDMFCLTAWSENCPWLGIKTPKKKSIAHRAIGVLSGRSSGDEEALSEPAAEASTQTAQRGPGFASSVWQATASALTQLGIWLWMALGLLARVLMMPLLWLSRRYRSVERAVLRWLAGLWRSLLLSLGSLRSRLRLRRAPPREVESMLVEPEGLTPPATQPVFSRLPATGEKASEPAQSYLSRGMKAVRQGEREEALRCFRLATEADASDEQAWLWRGAVADDPREKSDCFRRALALNPQNVRARAGLQQLGMTVNMPADTEIAESSAVPSRADDLEDMAVTWDCPDCTAINPRSVSRCQRCGRPSPRLERELGARDGFMKSGLDALRNGNEEMAYHYFSLAAETDRSNEKAWYWRAKTAPNLDEVVRCLRHITEINPDNAKARSDLQWALERQEAERPRPAPERPSSPTWQSTALPRLVAPLRRGLVQLASLSAFLLALLLALPYVVNLTDLSTTPEYRPYLELLPSFQLPELMVGAEGASFDLGAALPLLLAVLLLHAAFSLSDGGSLGMRIWTVLLGLAAGFLLLSYVTIGPVVTVGVALAALAALSSALGEARAEWHPEPRAI